jgi:hypothetical protein
MDSDVAAWAEIHFGKADLGDARRSKGWFGWPRR